MARLMSFPFELRSITTGMEWITSTNGTPVIETTTFRSGSAALRINATGGAENIHHIFRTTQGPCWTRFYFRVVAGSTGNDVIIISTLSGNTNLVGVRIDANETLEFLNLEDSAQVGASSSAISLDTWYRLEYYIDSTTLASTAIEARLYAASDESTLLWNPSGTINLALNPDRFRLGITAADATLDIIWDDGAINDDVGSFENSWPGEGEQIMLRPSAAGDNGAWTRGGTDSGANWSQTEEIPPDDVTTYVQSNTSGQIDDYNLDATPAAMASDDVIKCVQVGVRFAISSGSGADPDFVLRIKASASGTVEESANLSGAGDTSYQSYKIATPRQYALTLYDLPGASTTAWTKTDLDAAQIGVRETVTDTHFMRVSALWLVADHKPASGTLLVVQDATLALAAESPALTQHNLLVVADGLLALAAESPALTQHNALAVADALLALAAETPILTAHDPAIQLVVQDALLALAADSPALTQHNILVVADALLALAAESPTLTQHNALIVADALLGLAADGVALTQHNVIAVADALLALAADNVVLEMPGALTVQDATIALAVDNVALVQHGVLVVQDALIGLTADNISFGGEEPVIVSGSMAGPYPWRRRREEEMVLVR